MVLALPCRLNPSARSRSPTVSAPTRWPWRVSSPARWRVDFVVHRSGDTGSPRSSGSTRSSSAGSSPGSRSAARLRPPPGRRTRPSGAAPESSSSTPSDTVASRTPAARATSRIPPWPSERASAPISSRRCRSSRCGKIAWNFAATTWRVSSIVPIPHQCARSREATGYFSASSKHFTLLIGNYSREGFNHPGPAYMYVQAFGEYLFQDALRVVPTAWNAHLLSVFALDCFFLALAVAVVYGWTRSLAGAAACFAVFAGFAIAYPPIVNSDWMPYMYVLA